MPLTSSKPRLESGFSTVRSAEYKNMKKGHIKFAVHGVISV